jgi:carboxypeptidase C (cathepsin A)
MKLTDIGWLTTNVLSSNLNLWYYITDNATIRALRQSFVLTPALKVTVDPSVQQPTTNFPFAKKSTNANV